MYIHPVLTHTMSERIPYSLVSIFVEEVSDFLR
jgi:hypothetical protein